MDHSHMDHGDMDHGGNMCSMDMLFTWRTQNLCIVFQQWRITSTFSLILSLLAVVLICAGYEALRDVIRRYDAWTCRHANSMANQVDVDAERVALLGSSGQAMVEVSRRAHAIKSVLYGVQNLYAFMIMLIFMTYNGWVMMACAIGAGLGYYLFGAHTPATKETACH